MIVTMAAITKATAPAIADNGAERARAHVALPQVQAMMHGTVSPDALGKRVISSLPPGEVVTPQLITFLQEQ